MSSSTLTFSPTASAPLDPYLPPPPPVPSPFPSTSTSDEPRLPHLTLTFATSLDSSLSLSPGTQTVLSGPQSKAMTHYLRSRHAAILVGAGTAVADDPALNCRLDRAEHQPRPVVLDPRGRWAVGQESRVVQLASEGKGLAPWVVVAPERYDACSEKRTVLESVGGKVVQLPVDETGAFEWRDVLEMLGREGIVSVMVEGGGKVINSLLAKGNIGLVDSVIVTIAPTWLGTGGVVVSPEREDQGVAAARLRDVRWCPLGEDVVLCGRIKR